MEKTAVQLVYDLVKSGLTAKEIVNALLADEELVLEKEKEMLAGVWLDAQVAYQGDEYIKPSDPTFDEYYEETFNTK
jgi:hypothetical protein